MVYKPTKYQPLNVPTNGDRIFFSKFLVDSFFEESEKVVFHCRATAKKELPNRDNAISIRVDFHPREMRAQNVPDL